MNIIVPRFIYNATTTIGSMLNCLNGNRIGYTLEDVVRPDGAAKVAGQTAIAAGRYQIVLSFSARFRKILPEILYVPNFIGVRVHGGNDSTQTDGCLLCGKNLVNTTTIQERSAVDDLIKLLQDHANEKNWIEIVNTFPYKGV